MEIKRVQSDDEALVCGDLLIKRSGAHEMGVYATKVIIAETRIFQMDDSRIITPDAPLRPELGEDEKYCDYLGHESIVHNGIPDRFVNHSCDPNAYAITINGHRWEVARRQIGIGEEITNDYSINGVEDDPEEVYYRWACQCGRVTCRKRIVHSYFKLPQNKQREYVAMLDTWFKKLYRSELHNLARIAMPKNRK